jgi:amino acid adenylation domain-containing protein
MSAAAALRLVSAIAPSGAESGQCDRQRQMIIQKLAGPGSGVAGWRVGVSVPVGPAHTATVLWPGLRGPLVALVTEQPDCASMPARVYSWVRHDPLAVAVREVATGAQLRYGELWQRSTAVANRLRYDGVGAGTVVAVALPRGVDLVVALLGIARSGAAYLPLDPRAPTERWTQIASAAAATHVLVAGPDDPAPAGPAVIALSALDGQSGSEQVPLLAGEPERPFCVYFTSGTSGPARGVVVPQRAVSRLVAAPTYCTLAPGDLVASTANPAFDATTFEVWHSLCAGATVIALPDLADVGFDAWLDLLATERIGALFMTTTLFHLVARARPELFCSLDTLLVGGEQLEIALARRVLDAGAPTRLVNVYGPTETATFAAYYDCTPSSLAGLDRVPVGWPIQHTQLEIIDAWRHPVAGGGEGELVIGGPGVALGYLGEAQLTARHFGPISALPQAGIWYTTGDWARRLPCGAIEVLGRMGRQVNIAGSRVDLAKVEQALTATALIDVAIVETIGTAGSEELVAFVLPNTTTATAIHAATSLPQALRAAMAPSLPDHMIPTRWQIRSTLPMGPTGKADRAALLASVTHTAPDTATASTASTQKAQPPAPTPPTGAANARLRRIWHALVRRNRIR